MPFKNAKTLAPTAPAKKGSKARQVEIGNLKNLATLVAIKKSVESMIEAFEEDVKSQAVVEFVKTGAAAKARPDNFEGIDGSATASVQLKKKASNIALSAEEVDLLARFKIPTEKRTDVHGTYVFDPEALKDEAKMEAIAKLLEDAGHDDVIRYQEERSKTVVAEKALDEVFKLDPVVIGDILPVIASIAVKPKVDEAEIAEVIASLSKLITVSE